MRRSSSIVLCLGGVSAALFIAPSSTKTTHKLTAANDAVLQVPAPPVWNLFQPPPTTTTVAPTTTTTVAPPTTVAPRAPQTPPSTWQPVLTTQYTPPPTSGGSGGIWACIRQAESGGNYSINTSNGYFGAAQWLPATWNSAAQGAGYGQYANGRADLAPPSVQDAVAIYWQSVAGWGQWSTAAACGGG